MYRLHEGELHVLLVHPGGPFFKNKDEGAWTIPKGEPQDDEPLLDAARREFTEETGFVAAGEFAELTPIKQKGGKVVHAWAVAGDVDPAAIVSNTFRLEWPPKSGKQVEFPEIDRAAWFDLQTAERKINPAQAVWLAELVKRIS
jgi:predicted NUDIX family NTP pyrophosphohydrolase